MDEVILILMINESDREWNEGNSLRETRRRLRDTSDPFSISENAFMSIYRLSKEALHALITELSPFMPNAQRNTSVPHVLQVLAAVNLMASGSYQRRVGQDFLTCMSQTTISKSLHNVVNALNCIMGKWICFPVTEARQATIKKIFFDHTGFPGVIGAIDGTHIAIFPPEQEKEHLYINQKLYHSLNVLIVSDYKTEILAVNACHGGRTHDSRVFRSSQVFGYLQELHKNEEKKGSWLLGDSGYPLLSFLLTPKRNQPVGSPGARYTECHVKTRVAVERCIGILKGRWRCLRKERALHYEPHFAALIVNACCVLHNLALQWGILENEQYWDEIDQESSVPSEIQDCKDGVATQGRIIQWYFTD